MSIPVLRDYSGEEGKELSAKAFAYMAQEERQGRTVTFSESLRQVMRASARQLEQRQYRQYRDQAGDWADQSTMDADLVGWEAFQNISNFVLGLPRERGAINLNKAVEAVNNYFGGPTIFAAGQYVVGVRQNQIVSNMSPGNTSANLRNALGQTLRELPPLAAVYNGSIDDAAVDGPALMNMFLSVKWS